MPRFSDIHGQDAAHRLVRRTVARDRLPHAYLFYGSRGVGKTTTAFALAQMLNCENPSPDDSCGSCRSCRRIHRFRHPDVHWFFPMAGSERGRRLRADDRIDHIASVKEERLVPGEEGVPPRIHGITYPGAASIAIGGDEDSRPGSIAELRNQAGFAPVEARFRVFVVTEAERMTREAANSLLKVLEEPPPRNLLVLTTHRPGELLDTIVSRCQSVRFRDLSEGEIVKLLEERGGWRWEKEEGKRRYRWIRTPPDPGVATLAAALAGGSLTRADALAGEDLVRHRDTAVEFLGLEAGDPELHAWIAGLDEEMNWSPDKKVTAAENDRRVIELVIDFGLLWYGDLLRAATGSEVPLVNRDREADIRKAAEGLGVEAIGRRVRRLEDARQALRGNVYRPLVLYPLVFAPDRGRPQAVSR